jgi:hypothetical protein
VCLIWSLLELTFDFVPRGKRIGKVLKKPFVLAKVPHILGILGTDALLYLSIFSQRVVACIGVVAIDLKRGLSKDPFFLVETGGLVYLAATICFAVSYGISTFKWCGMPMRFLFLPFI